MKFENAEYEDLIFSRTKRGFEVKWKTFFFIWLVLSFRPKKKTSKNVANTTFKLVTGSLVLTLILKSLEKLLKACVRYFLKTHDISDLIAKIKLK